MLRHCIGIAMAMSLSACASPGSQSAVVDLLKQMVTDPNCSHDDDLTVGAGGLAGPMITGHAGRHCPGPAVGAVATPPPVPVAGQVAPRV